MTKALGIVLGLALAGCAVGPDHEAPRPRLPAGWSGLGAQGAAQESVARERREDLSEWWRSFDDPVLASLTERALERNLDLREAAARVRQAQAARGVALAGLLPRVGAGASYSRQRWSETGQFPADGGAFSLLQATFDAAWEIDVFGGNRRGLEAAGAELDASLEAARDVRVSLQAEVAREYVLLRGLQARLEIARRNLATQRGTADLTRARADAGQATELDLTRAEAQVATTEASIPPLEAGERWTIHRLAVLLGREPGALVEELARAGPIPRAPGELPIGLPVDLLWRRPDLRRAERELAAETARIGVATADLYPRLFLLGSLGTLSLRATDLVDGASRAWSFGPELRWSILEGGRIRANIALAEGRAEEAALRFERALLQALREVEDALVAHAREQERRARLSRAVAAQRQAVALAGERWAQGLVDLLDVLDAERALHAAEESLALSEQAVAASAIALFEAAGGGWREDPPAGEG